LLVRAPASLTRTGVQYQVREWVTAALRHSPALKLPRGPLWGHGAWCGVLVHARSLRTARQKIMRMTAYKTPGRFAEPSGPQNDRSVRQQPASRIHDVDRLGEHIILERWRIR
jgi:hypothetical protein